MQAKALVNIAQSFSSLVAGSEDTDVKKLQRRRQIRKHEIMQGPKEAAPSKKHYNMSVMYDVLSIIGLDIAPAQWHPYRFNFTSDQIRNAILGF